MLEIGSLLSSILELFQTSVLQRVLDFLTGFLGAGGGAV